MGAILVSRFISAWPRLKGWLLAPTASGLVGTQEPESPNLRCGPLRSRFRPSPLILKLQLLSSGTAPPGAP